VLKKLFIAFLLVTLSACASNGKRDETRVGEPGTFTTGSPHADAIYNVLVAELALKRNLPEIAAQYYLAATKQTKDPVIAGLAVRVATFAKDDAAALEAAEIWQQVEPENREVLEYLGVLYLRNSQFEKAKSILVRLLEEEAGKTTLSSRFLGMGALLQREADPTAAHELAQHLIKGHEKLAEAQYFAASIALRSGKKEMALEHATVAVKLNKKWDQAIILKGRVLETMERMDETLKELENFLKKQADAHEVRRYYASVLLNERQYKQARSQYEILVVKMPDDPDILFALAVLAYEFKELDEAQAYLEQVDQLGKRSPRETYFLGQIAEEKKEYDRAIEWYSRVHRGQYALKAQLRIGAVLLESKSLEAARKHVQQINAPTEQIKLEILRFEGSLIKDAKEYGQAFDFYSDLLDDFKNNPEILYDRALIAERLDKLDLAVKDLSYIVKQQADNAAALNALGYTLADRTDRLDEALGYIKRALELQPNDPAIMDSMGWVQYRLGNHQDALKFLQQAMDIIEDGEVSAHFGEVLWQLGRKDEAKKVWQKAAKKFSDSKTLANTMKRFGL